MYTLSGRFEKRHSVSFYLRVSESIYIYMSDFFLPDRFLWSVHLRLNCKLDSAVN